MPISSPPPHSPHITQSGSNSCILCTDPVNEPMQMDNSIAGSSPQHSDPSSTSLAPPTLAPPLPVVEIGAISCMIRRPDDGKLKGYNVDYLGAIAAIEEALGASNGAPASVSPLAGKLFVVMGAGGAGKALAYGAYEKGARVVANRTYGEKLYLVSSSLLLISMYFVILHVENTDRDN
uniref:Uncharacterized protein n=1 Tax=Populus alba TaxID=43335 RepID=A0A4U5R1M3_POPAL|nr:hypothetical protein D5086_0000012560 [Populus alba]